MVESGGLETEGDPKTQSNRHPPQVTSLHHKCMSPRALRARGPRCLWRRRGSGWSGLERLLCSQVVAMDSRVVLLSGEGELPVARVGCEDRCPRETGSS